MDSRRSSPPRLRSILLTGSVFFITVVGAIYGARLGLAAQAAEAKKVKAEIPREVLLEQLYDARAKIVAKRDGLREKIRQLKREHAEEERRGGRDGGEEQR